MKNTVIKAICNDFLNEDITMKELAERYKCSSSTISKYLKSSDNKWVYKKLCVKKNKLWYNPELLANDYLANKDIDLLCHEYCLTHSELDIVVRKIATYKYEVYKKLVYYEELSELEKNRLDELFPYMYSKEPDDLLKVISINTKYYLQCTES